MKSKSLLLFYLLFFLLACNSPESKKQLPAAITSAGSVPGPQKVSSLEPALFQADSLQVVYYDNPDGDSLRYSRFFSFTETNDSSQVNTLLKELDQVYVQHHQPKSCRSEGKLYLLQGENILKTIYFSARKDSCTYFYFIKDGSFFYWPLTDKAGTLLKENRKFAHQPKAGR